MEISLTLEQAQKFIGMIGQKGWGIRTRALNKLVPILEETLRTKVFHVPHSDTVSIKNIRELQSLIAKSGKGSHKPASARPGKPYNQEYLATKHRYGEYYPHKFWNYGFYQGIEVTTIIDHLIMRADPIFKRGFDYMSHHERTRSVLKRAFLEAWEDIIQSIIKHYAEEAKNL
ncbi:MAG: hypothetical protein V3V14_08300 [Saprospiraceae bacterium]